MTVRPLADPQPAGLSDGLIDRLVGLIGPSAVLTAAEDRAPYLKEWRGRYQGQALVVVRPGSTADLATVVRVCAEAGVSMVPQGGNTGLVGGAVAGADQVLISTDRLTAVRSLDVVNNTITVEAGVILQSIQEAADAADRLFPLSLGAEGSCRIGGNLSTNAGGTGVLRYGNARDLTLGLEVVLPDGRIWDGLRGLRKNNTGYDLKHLFIGAEGTLGIITAAVLKLFPKPRDRATALAAVPDPDAALALLTRAQAGSGDAVTGCELMCRQGIDFALEHIDGVVDPLSGRSPWYVLIEFTSPAAPRQGAGLTSQMETVLAAAFEAGEVTDAAIAASDGQARALWFIREAIVDGQRPEGGSIKHDIAVPVSAVPRFLTEAGAAMDAYMPGIRPVPFGHLGDGNLHYNISQPVGMDRDAFLAHWDPVTRIIHDIAAGLGGTFSAEHGVGRSKRAELATTKAGVELDLMRAVKTAIDPAGLMNPGKVL